MPRKIPTVPGLALTILRTAHGWLAKDLAARVRVRRTTISGYETGTNHATRDRLEELARAMGLDDQEVERALLAASLVLSSPPSPGWSPVDPTEEERRVIDKAAATAGRAVGDRVRRKLTREAREGKADHALDQGKELARRLMPYSEADRRVLVEGAPDYQHWGLAVVLSHASETAAADDPRKALKLADLALLVARHVPGPETWRSRLQGYCTAFLANAQRVASDLPGAEATFATAWQLWRAGQDGDGLLSEARLFDLEASLRRDQRRFDEALGLHEEAFQRAQPGEVGRFLLKKSFTLQEKGEHDDALQILEQATQVVVGDSQPRLRFGLRYNQAANLVRLGRASEAARLVPEVRELAERLGNGADLVRTLWLEGNIAAGLERLEEAFAALEQVRRDFERRKIPYDYALVSLDLALLYRKQGHFSAITELARELLAIFRAQGVHREAVAALLLFQDAAERQQVTEELVRRLQGYLLEAKVNPKLHFKA